MRLGVALALSVCLGSLAGCIDIEPFYAFDPDAQYRNPGVFDGRYQGAGTSYVLKAGNLTPPTIPDVVRLVSDLPAYRELADEELEDSESRVDITMAIWRPRNHTEPVPIIVDAGPYFEQGQGRIDEASQTTPFNLRNFLPHGYAVVQLAIRGTGTSGGCMDLMGPSEQHDLDQAITWLGQQPWSNGRIAMVGASYDGSTPWIVAATGNPYLKTIVPTSGLPDIYDLMFRNGSAETRGPIMHNRVYWGFGFDQQFPQRPGMLPSQVPWVPPAGMGTANGRADYQDRQNLLCAEVAEGSLMGQYATHTGHRGGELSTYWTERDYRQRVLDNYQGSVFLVHGLQDWNVDPHVAIPFNQRLRDAGIEMKEWYGQWGHAYPDSGCEPADPWVVVPCRLDFADILYRWFERYLKDDQTIELGPSIQVQDNLGFWRNADSYPPRDAIWTPMRLGADGRLGGGGDSQVQLLPPSVGGAGPPVALVSEPLEEDLYFSGMPQLRLPFAVDGQGGQIGAWLFDQAPTGRVRAPGAAPIQTIEDGILWRPVGIPIVGHAQMNLRYYAGGEEPQPLMPGERYVARVEFEPLEVRIPAGNRLVLWLFQFQYPDHQSSTTQSTVTLYFDDQAQLRLPVLDVDPRTVFPVPGVNFLNRTYVPEMYVRMPEVPPGFAMPAAPWPSAAPGHADGAKASGPDGSDRAVDEGSAGGLGPLAATRQERLSG